MNPPGTGSLEVICGSMFSGKSEDNLYNNRLVTDFNLRLYRAASSKAINSMSRGEGTSPFPRSCRERGRPCSG